MVTRWSATRRRSSGRPPTARRCGPTRRSGRRGRAAARRPGGPAGPRRARRGRRPCPRPAGGARRVSRPGCPPPG
ncbi:hypothetical protein EF918_20210 [Streptomyces sp. WAC06614]|nr:hypothetical protein EF918_20210 [Streptomyces sp. WAC06614]